MSCLSDSTRDRVIKYVPSPNGRYKAVVLKRPGGVTTRPNRSVRVLASNERIAERGSPLSVQIPYYGCLNLTERDCADIARIDVRWISDDSLVISVDSRAQVTAESRDLGGGARLTRGVPDGVRLVVRTRYD